MTTLIIDFVEVTVEVAVKGAWEMVAYSSARPRLCKVDGKDAEFAYENGVVTVAVPWTGSSSKLRISEGPVYVSDSVGSHDFALLRRLALPDGTVLRCEHHALPTRDCLFLDPLHDGQTMLKIWNLNKFSGVLGAFNCQGGGWSPEARRNKCASQCSVPARAGPADIEWKQGKSHPVPDVEDATQFAVYYVESKKLELLLPDETVEITLQPFNYELLVVAPVSVLRLGSGGGDGFAPIGLANMLNSGGAMQAFETNRNGDEVTVAVAIKGAGEMVAYSSARPRLCKVDGEDAEFAYEDGVVTVAVPWTGSSSKLARVEYIY
ncbi:galactinol--sucrose galactosyltransferase-like [Lolium rigidum]|uniref:galactinol--sucrose galactosyltransferase-like n=1 Tax=Lolium rigidum TaxID=89674 RepID=UPI001F5E14A5|nr:galactinol--sucrose galactosyltransferase-like [Lolium rigidum]